MSAEIEQVTVIIPVFNEKVHISQVLKSIINQNWPGLIEIIIVDGNSTDSTCKKIEAVKKILPANRNILLLQNPQRYIPISLNIACQNASSEIIIRLDGHTYAPASYVADAVEALKKIKFQGIVGGRWKCKAGSKTAAAKAITIAISNPFGVGNALYRTFNSSVISLIDVDTVPFGAFTKKLWADLGGYDERLLANEDYDFNYRAKKQGYRIVLNSKIILEYFARPNLTSLGKQYFRYGYWVAQFFAKHKRIPALRKLLPLSLILALVILPLIEPQLMLSLLVIYLGTNLAFSAYEGLIRRKQLVTTGRLMITFPVLHFAYGLGNVVGFFNSLPFKKLWS